MFWNPEIETMRREDLRKLQYRSLRERVDGLYCSNAFYRRRMDEHNVKPGDITCLEDISKLPFMFKQDLRDNYPTKMFSVPITDVVRYHVSSGTTGKPTLVGYTRNDLDYWTESLARSLTSIGIGEDDTLQVSYGYGLFTGGLGLHYGAEKVGAAVLPAGTGSTERQLELMQDLDVTVIACTPSYLVHMIDVAERMGLDFRRDTKLRKPYWVPNPGPKDETAYRRAFRVKPTIYTERPSSPVLCSPNAGTQRNHIGADIAYVETIDPDTGEVLEDGEKGNWS